ncbi:hypothetical protein [Nocardia sp. CA-120079]|uniref:hypothetical protein n=1 Tax=Nocardia sp. CA-120079 TaxID=3239974 RepID=UPI003D96E97B
MGNDEQIGFDIEFDDKTQAFLDWVAPERMESEIRAFLSTAVPNLGNDAEWWKPPVSTRVLEAAVQLFGDWAGFTAPENWSLADGLVRFLGECHIRRHPDSAWTNRPQWGAPLYTDIGPAVCVRGDSVQSVVSKAETLFRRNYGPDMVEYNIDRAHLPA